MKIGIEHVTNIYGKPYVRGKENNVEQREAALQGQQFDQVVFTSSSRDIEEKLFTEQVIKGLSQQVQAKKDNSQKIEQLREAVRGGSYVPDSRETAARILLMGGKEE